MKLKDLTAVTDFLEALHWTYDDEKEAFILGAFSISVKEISGHTVASFAKYGIAKGVIPPAALEFAYLKSDKIEREEKRRIIMPTKDKEIVSLSDWAQAPSLTGMREIKDFAHPMQRLLPRGYPRESKTTVRITREALPAYNAKDFRKLIESPIRFAIPPAVEGLQAEISQHLREQIHQMEQRVFSADLDDEIVIKKETTLMSHRFTPLEQMAEHRIVIPASWFALPRAEFVRRITRHAECVWDLRGSKDAPPAEDENKAEESK